MFVCLLRFYAKTAESIRMKLGIKVDYTLLIPITKKCMVPVGTRWCKSVVKNVYIGQFSVEPAGRRRRGFGFSAHANAMGSLSLGE